jgi:hypothetical protein
MQIEACDGNVGKMGWIEIAVATGHMR